MGPLWRTAWRRWRQRPLQALLLLLGVALGVAMMVSIDIANGSAQRAFQLSTDAIAGRATHRLVAGERGLDEDLYRSLRVEAGVYPAAPVVEGYVQAPALGSSPFRLVGIEPLAEAPFRNYLAGIMGESRDDMTGNGLTPLLTERDTVLLSAEVAEAAGVELGDEVEMILAGQPKQMKVVGLLNPTDSLNREALNNIIFADIGTGQELLDMVGRLSHIDLILDAEREAEVVAWLPTGVQLVTTAAQSNAIQQMTAAFRLNLTALSLLALVVGMFLIYNTVTFSVVQRRPLFGILRCLGVTGQQLFRLIMLETLALSSVGVALGLGLGVFLGRFLVQLVTRTINDLYFVVTVQSVAVPPSTLVKGIVIGLLAALLAALVPAVEAMRTSPQSTLRRSTLESRVEKVMPWLVLASGVLAAVGGLLLWWPTNNLVVAFSGLFAVLFAAAALTAPLTAWSMRLVTPVGGRLLGVLGRMAPRDIVRSLSRTSVAIAALMTAVSVIVGVSIMIGSFRGTVVQWLGQTLQADVFISPPQLTATQLVGSLPLEVVEGVRDWPGVAEMVTARQVDVLAPALGRPMAVAAVDGDVSRGERPFLWYEDESIERLWERLLAGEGVIISEPLFVKEGMSVPPEPIVLLTEEGEKSFPIIGVFYDYTSDRGVVLMGREQYVGYWGDDGYSSIGLFLEEGVEAEGVVRELEAAFGGGGTVSIRSNATLREGSLVIFDRTFAITAALQLLATIVAFIGVLSALMSLQLERARELGVLRANGMTLRQLWQLILLETGLMGTVAGVLAMPTGYVLAWVLIYVINVRSFGWTLQMALEPSYFLEAFMVALVAALLAGVYPAWRLGGMVIATAVRSE
ncbi:MAG TPA: FtsX-like permease family protein [Anaerolineae bacterium]|nr:FtsX-like permease family protein [Anaerolineae bacterium]